MTEPITYFEDLSLGQEATLTITVTEDDIVKFAEISGDTNPVHLDQEYAATTMFKECISHGMLTASYISAVFGTILPGPGSIYVTQSLKFTAPVKIGDTVLTTVKITQLNPDKSRAIFNTVCEVGGNPVLKGEAELMIPKRPN